MKICNCNNINTNNIRKQTICFFVGYTADFNVSTSGVYGSELALKSLAEFFSKTHNVYVFGAILKDSIINNVQYFNSNKLNQFMNDNIVDVMIISRYIYYFLEFNNKALKTYIWFHDVLANAPWDFKPLPDAGKYLLQNLMDKIDGIIVLTDSHKTEVLNYYNFDSEKVFIIGNAIDVTRYNKYIKRVKNRFIYTSSPERGLKELVDNFTKIRQELPDAELWIYRGENEFTTNHSKLLEQIRETPYIKFMGRIDNNELVDHQMMADFWYYPTNFTETYCISALEALMAGCICITSDLGALKDTVSNRGILLTDPIYSEEYFKKAIDQITKIANNEDLKEHLRTNGILWAQNQTWENRSKEWFKLFDYNK